MSNDAPKRVLSPRRRSRMARLQSTLGANLALEFPSDLVGQTEHFDVYAATSLGAGGLQVAHGVLGRCERDYATLAGWFGLQPSHFNAVVAPVEGGGAYHRGCSGLELYCAAELSPVINEDFTSALVVAEVVEVFQALQGGGWNCGASNGEGLSRVLAEELYPGVLDGFSTASDWLDTDRPDWVNQNAGSDGDTGANGCSVLFLFWLHYQLGYTWQQICQAPGSTLAETYRQLAGVNTDPFPDFSRLLGQNYSPGAPSNLTHDNPFPLGARQFATAIPSKGTRLIPRASLVRS